ncbi:hypothetical protein [Clavibacter michiganensis]|uniref:hypothetical protein n=1 Tax=Clavibacter michiganensis TaxID=28447 RepID=UPI00130ECF3E|nr:hypothetical protein [Clavibacter michiganensis]
MRPGSRIPADPRADHPRRLASVSSVSVACRVTPAPSTYAYVVVVSSPVAR